MRKLVGVLAIVALMAVPAMAGPSYTSATKAATLSNLPVQTDLRAPGDPYIYSAVTQNQGGYYVGVGPLSYWMGEYVGTTVGGPFQITGFTAGWVAGADTQATTMYIDFYFDDGYFPYSGNYSGGYTIPITNDGYGHVQEFDVSSIPVNVPTNDLIFTYAFDVQDLYVGVYNSDGATIGTDYYPGRWLQHTPGHYYAYWFGGFPNADLLFGIQGYAIPEPATLALLGLGGLAILRRRQ